MELLSFHGERYFNKLFFYKSNNSYLLIRRYLFSASISLYNKWMFDPEHLNFRLPLFTTSVHMIVQFSLATSVLYFFPKFRSRPASGVGDVPGHVWSLRDHLPSNRDNAIMPRKFYLTRIGPCGLATGLDIGLGNMSLVFITLTFYSEFD
jgi:solute carrier family 35 protein C2